MPPLARIPDIRPGLKAAAVAATVLVAGCDDGPTGNVHRIFPARVSPDATYVFYVHGRPAADYEAIAPALAARGFEVVAEPRAEGSDPEMDALTIKERVRTLLAFGVPVGHLAVIGTGEGGAVTLAASAILQVPDMSFVALAACPPPGAPGHAFLERVVDIHARTLRGRVLSLIDVDDSQAGSCAQVLDRSAGGETWEVELDSGDGGAVFRRPDPAWLDETITWIKG